MLRQSYSWPQSNKTTALFETRKKSFWIGKDKEEGNVNQTQIKREIESCWKDFDLDDLLLMKQYLQNFEFIVHLNVQVSFNCSGNSANAFNSVLYAWHHSVLKGEVRTINDRNICERRSCMKNNGKSPTFKFVSGEEKRPSEVQRVSRGWRLPGATHSSADLTWIRKWLEIQAPELSELESVDLELGCCCSDLDKQVSDEICRTRKRQFEIPFRL